MGALDLTRSRSNPQIMSGPPPDPPRPTCARCRLHGIISPRKGHGTCRFLSCTCRECQRITQRNRLTTLRRRLAAARMTGGPEQRAGAAARSTWASGPRPDPGGEPASGSDHGEVLPGFLLVPDSEPMISLRIPYFTFRMLDNFPPPPHFLLHVPLLPPGTGRLYEGSLMFPHPQQEDVYPGVPPPPPVVSPPPPGVRPSPPPVVPLPPPPTPGVRPPPPPVVPPPPPPGGKPPSPREVRTPLPPPGVRPTPLSPPPVDPPPPPPGGKLPPPPVVPPPSPPRVRPPSPPPPGVRPPSSPPEGFRQIFIVPTLPPVECPPGADDVQAVSPAPPSPLS